MHPSAFVRIESALVFLVVAALAAVQARAFRGAQRHQVQEICRRRGRPERSAEIIEGSETIAFIAASVVVMAAVVATLLASRWLVEATAGSPALKASAVAGWILLAWLMLVVVPMLFTKFIGAWFVVATWSLWRPIVAVTAPAVKRLAGLASMIARLLVRPAKAAAKADGQEELRAVVDEAHREGWLPGGARAMIEGVMSLDQVRVGQIMTPRTNMICVPLAMPWGEIVRLVSESGHTRLPVWDRSPEDVVGILHSRELLGRLAEPSEAGRVAGGPPPELRPLLRPPYFVPESMSVQKLLRELQRGRTHLALVTDEFGGVSGLVTIEDALEEIVGEISDEHDEAFSDGLRIVSDHVCEVMGHVRITDLNARFGTRLPEEADYETVGGLVFHEFGRVPHVGDRITSHGVAMEVLAATRRRVELIRVERSPEATGHGG
ncbi:MAG: hemolysin family protein [Planctomycetia bacterium]